MSGEDRAISANVRVALARRNIKQKVVAEAIGMPPVPFSQRCNNRTAFRAHELVQIAAAIDCPVEELFLGERASA